MVNIILVGAFGRMGKSIQQIIEHGDMNARIKALVVEEGSIKEEQKNMPLYRSIEEALHAVVEKENNSQKNVIIDFSTVENTMYTAHIAKEWGIPLVIGTTGFSCEQKTELAKIAEHIPVLLSSNMSRGITALLRFLPALVAYLGDDYDVELVEAHHKSKKDSPSGTGISLANSIAQAKGWDLAETVCYHREGIIGERPHKEIGIQTMRGGGATGTHSIFFFGEEEEIEITHRATSRATFARGAVYSACWLCTQKAGKVYTMLDVE